ncbi:MAG: flagellar biosynthetic protein FliO, partial [Oscillospiraceae bacterium]
LYLLVIAVILYLCYVLSKYVAKKMNNTQTVGSKMKIIDRVAFGQDRCIAICLVCDRYYLIGVAPQNIKILAQLDPQFFEGENMIKTPPSFAEAMASFLNKKNDKKNT